MTSPRLPLDATTRLLVLTGAGVSAESGLATFRGAGGLWMGQRVEDVASPDAFARDPALVWAFYSERRTDAAAAEPNAAHRALAAAEERMAGRFLLVTQNVDGLHARAGSHALVELHGSLWRTRCSSCDRRPVEDRAYPVPEPPTCEGCGAILRPDIVWFGEPLDPAAEWRTKRFIKDAEIAGAPLVFLAIGTSGQVYPAAGYARYARDFGATTWLANLEPSANEADFDRIVTGPASEVVPALLG